MLVYIAEHVRETDNITSLVGVYSSKDKALAGIAAHKLWYKNTGNFDYYIRMFLVDANNTNEIPRYRSYPVTDLPNWLK